MKESIKPLFYLILGLIPTLITIALCWHFELITTSVAIILTTLAIFFKYRPLKIEITIDYNHNKNINN